MTTLDNYTGWGDWPGWVDEADEPPACRGHPTDLFFPETRAPGVWAKIAAAKAICASCPLLDTCKTWALEQPAQKLHGIWGGTTTYERRKRQEGTGAQPPQFHHTRTTEGDTRQ